MPATSDAQKRLSCMALAYQKYGESALKGVRNKEQVKKMAESMSEEDLVDMCGSKVEK